MRSLGGKGSKTITATTRQLESLIRISQALAKMKLSNTATVDDVNESIRYLYLYLYNDLWIMLMYLSIY
jgi:DNA replication licensing factor MCM4